MTTIPDRVSQLEGAYEQVDRRLGDLTNSVNGLRQEVRGLGSKIDGARGDVDEKSEAARVDVDAKIDGLRREINAKFNTLIVVTATGGLALTGAILTLAFRI